MRSRETDKWMLAQALDMLDQAERMHRRFFALGGSREQRPSWEPPVDVFETASEILIQVALPGVKAEHTEVVVDDDALLVRGDRRMVCPSREAAIQRLEIPYGRFERRIALPAGRFEIVQRGLEDGCLILRLRKL
jgi:HSP20 family molecular chaperone IbpA